MNHQLTLCFIACLLFAITSCRNDQYVELNVPNCDTSFYQRKIKPIIKSNCATSGCHDGTNATPDFNLYLNVKHAIDIKINGVPELLYRINLPVSDPDHMPNNGYMLSSENREEIVNWINQGYYGCE